MPAALSESRYSRGAIALHRMMVIGIFGLANLGLVMTRVASPPMPTFELYQLHKSIGIVVGAAQAGLSIAARLTLLGMDALLVDSEARIGDSWRRCSFRRTCWLTGSRSTPRRWSWRTEMVSGGWDAAANC